MEVARPTGGGSNGRSEEPVHIVADDRERRSPVVERLAAVPNVCLEIRRLSVGDYEVEGHWTFERKTVEDFEASLLDGRLFTQAGRLGACPGGRALILEGGSPRRNPSGVSQESWIGALVSLGLAFHLPTLPAAGPDETVRILMYAARQVMRQRDTVFVPVRRRPRTLERQRLQVLAALPGVGGHRARLLLERFGSIEAVVVASEAALRTVRGVGQQTAGRIRAVVGKPREGG